jgi:hypothetical protein
MSRLCSFEIQYRNQSFPALVSVLYAGNDLICRVHFVQSQLRYVAPGDVLVYNLKEGLKQPENMPPELTQEIQRCICHAGLDKRQRL